MLVVLASAFTFVGHAVPHENEHVYLVRLRALHDPSYLRGDWTFGGDFNEHLVFNRLFSPLTAVLSTEILGWVGRIACWTVLAVLLLKLAGRLGVRPLPAAVALAVWVPCQVRLVGADWVFGTFEAKPIAYTFLFGALLLALRGSVVPALVCSGLAFSLHPGIGLWGVPPLVATMAIERDTRRTTLRWSWLAALLAVPGVVGVLLELGGTAASRDFYQSFVHEILPFHLDPFYFGIPTFVLLTVMFGFSVTYHLWWARPSQALHFVGVYQLLLVIPFVAGVVAYFAGAYDLLKYIPFRIFPVVIGVLFALDVALVWQDRRRLWASRRTHPSTLVLGATATLVVAALIVWNVPKQAAFSARDVYRSWTREDDDLDQALRWVADHTPEPAVAIMPPGRQRTFYLGERPQVGNVKALVFEDIVEWRQRIEDQLGEDAMRTEVLLDEERMEDAYDRLTADDIARLQGRYGAEYLVSRSEYDFEVVHRDGDYKVYRLAVAT